MSVESLEDRLLLAGAGPQLISIFPNAGVTQPEDTGGRLQQNEVLETAPRELVFRFNPGQTIDPGSIRSGIEVFRSGFDNDFNNGSVPVEIGSIQIGDQPNEVILRFASTLPDDQYQILFRGAGANPLQNTMDMPFNNGVDLSFFFEVDRGGQIEAVVHEPIVRSQILTVTSTANLTDGVTFTVQAGGKPITFEFDNNGTSNADGDNVFAIDLSGATGTTEVASRIGLALLNAAAVHGSAFGLETGQGNLPNSLVISASATSTFSPAISLPVGANGSAVTGITLADGAIEQRENFVNVHFNSNDPLNAVGRATLVIPPAANNGAFVINDGAQFTANNGTTPVTFTMDSGPAGRFNVNIASNAVIRDGDFISLDGQRYEFNTGPVLQVSATSLAEMTIGGTFTLTDNNSPSANSVTFEFTNGNSAAAGRIAINLAGVANRSDIVSRIVTAINARSATGFRVTATALANGSGRITLVNDTNVVVSAQNGFSRSGNYGVSSGTAVNVEENFTSAQLARAISDAVNGAANRGYSNNLVNFPTFTQITASSFSNPAVFANLNLMGNSGPLSINYFVGQSGAQIANAIANAISSQAGYNAVGRSGVVAGGWAVQLANGTFTVPSGSAFTAYSAANPATVESPAFYQLINTDGTVRLPDEVIYNADAGVATLRFAAPLNNGTYTIRIGESFEATNTLATTVNLGTRFGNTPTVVNDFIGGDPTRNALNRNDIDLYRFEVLTAGSVNITLNSLNGLNGFIRLFRADGSQLATGTTSLTQAISAGAYLVGISSQGNQAYSALNGSGAAGGTSTGSYRLTITPNVAGVPASDDNSSFGTATNLGNLGIAGQVVSAVIQPQNAVFNLPLPLEPGGNDEPGHRDIPIAGENHIDNGPVGRGTDIQFANGIPTIAYTFDLANPYGVDPQGNALFNAITTEQQQRTREIFELYALITGVQFVETQTRAEAIAQGLPVTTIVTGDLRALDPTVPTGPGGVGGIATLGPGLAIMDAGENFTAADNLYGAKWFRIAMHEIGHNLGLHHDFDLSSIMGGGLGGEPVFPGDNDIVHIRRLFRRDSIDVDMYQFSVTEAGTVTIETLAERFPLPEQASQLNTVIQLYRVETDGSRTLIAQNDDYYGNDSFMSLRLERGTYFVGVSSVGNEDYDPSVSNSGSTGLTDGKYELRIDLRPDLQPIPDDLGSVNPQNVVAKGRSAIRDVDNSLQFDGGERKATALDGDGDGRAGGVFSFSFQAGDTIFVDKQAANYATSGPLGSITNPYREIDLALAAANALQANHVSMNNPTPVIVRIVGNSGADGQLGTLGDNVAYEIGINSDPVNPRALVDGAMLAVPRDINVVIDAGAVFKLNRANLDAGSSAQGIDRSGGSIQILGTTFNDVIFTSWHDDSIGGDSDGVFTLGANPGDWGGVVFRGDSDYDFEYRATQTKRNIFATNGGNPNPNNPFRYTFTGFPIPATGATLSFLAFGEFLAANENLLVQFVDSAGNVIPGSPSVTLFDNLGNNQVNTLFEDNGANARSIGASITLTKDQFNLVASDGSLRVRVTASASVDNINVIESLRVDLSVGTALPVFLNTANHATLLYAGGPVVVDSISRDFDAIHLVDARPTVTFNTIVQSANAAISGNPNSFNDTFEDPRRYDHHLDRLGPDIHGNSIFSNEINGVRVRTSLNNGVPLDKLSVPARFTSTDVVYVITENLVIDGSPGGLIVDRGSDPDITSDDVITKRSPGRLRIDPGVIVKLAGARIEMERGGSNLIAEGTPEDPIIFTSINDDGIGAGGSFDTNNDSLPPRLPAGIGSFGGTQFNFTGTNGGGETSAFGESPLITGADLTQDVIDAANDTFHGPDGVGKDGPLARLGWSLNLLLADYRAYVAGGRVGAYTTAVPYLRTVGENVVIELSAAAGNLNALRAEVQAQGYQILAVADPVIAVVVPIGSLDDLVNLQHARVIKAVYIATTNVGSTTSQGSIALNADAARTIFNVDGRGVTIGVLSDSFNTSGSGSYAADISSGDLPGPGNPLGNTTPVTVIQDFPGGSDEGRAMLQLIHDVAPGAELQFATAFDTPAVFAANIRALRDAGSDIIVDDIGYATSPIFQDGIVAQAVDEVVADGVAYFSAAGNSARGSYESAFTDSGVAGPTGGTFHDFDPGAGVDTMQQITIPPFALARFVFQWDQPFGSLGGAASTSDIDFLLFDSAGQLLTGATVLQGQDMNVGGDAFEFAGVINPNATPLVVNVGIVHQSGPLPGVIKYIDFDGVLSIDEFATNSSTSFGHTNAAGAEAIGAAAYFDTPAFGTSPPLLEFFSSAGGASILFDTAGNRLTTPEIRQTPDIVAPDGTNTTFFGFDVEGDGFPNFFGTSAAAPHAAAVAALMLQAAGGGSSLTPSQIYNIMETTAIDMGVAGFDSDSGFGLLNALGAVTQSQGQGGGPVGQQPAEDDWSGLVFNAASSGNFDYVQVRYAGGTSPIAGGFAGFNPVEIIQADVRISNSIFENNGDGRDPDTTSANRIGRGANTSATIFVRGAQPIIVSNILQDNQGDVISINANAMQAVIFDDPGRATGPIYTPPLFGTDDPNATTEYANNFGPLIRNNRLAGNEFNGMAVRGGELTTETVWDDTDIVHIVRNEIIVPNLHTFGGLRLQSSSRESLVVKLFGPSAGFTASGSHLDIDDRVGGTVEIVGAPGRPVVLTSLYDNSVGAGFQPDGVPLLDTVAPNVRQAAPGDWRSVLLDQFSNDRNLAVYNERERPTRLDFDVNNLPNIQPNGPETLGTLAPSLPAADDNRRAGFEVHGFINTDDPTDQDVYSFTGTAGTEVWFDIDRTAGSLDTVLELINASGTVVFARSNDSQAEQVDPSLYDGLALPMRKDDRNGEDFYSTNPKDAGMRVILPGTVGTANTYFIRVRSNGPSIAAAAENQPGTADGLTSGEYQLQIRLQQRDEHPGSTVIFSQIRFATNGIEVRGLPGHSPLVSEAGEGAGNNDSQANADNVGNLLDSDLNTIGVAGNLLTRTDVDFYQFNVTYQGLEQIAGVNDPASGDVSNGFSTIFDIDWADGLARANSTLYIFNSQGQLILTGTDSNIADDQPGPLGGNDLTDPSRGTVGKLDPFIGSVELPEGTYYAVVTANANMPQVLSQYVNANSTTALTRLEPVDSINRIAEDHIGSQGGMTFQPAGSLTPLVDSSDPSISLTSSIVPWHLGDVSLFVSQSGNNTTYYTIDPFTGAVETRLNNTGTLVRDIAIRRQSDRRNNNDFTGDLVAFQYSNQGFDQGNFLTIDSGNGATINSQNDGIQTATLDNMGNPVFADNHGLNINALTYSDGPSSTSGLHAANQTQIYAVGTNFGDFADPFGASRNVLYRYDLNGVGQNITGVSRNAAQAFASDAKTDIGERGVLDTTSGGTPGSVLVAPSGAAINAAGLAGDGHVFQLNDNGVPLVFEMDAGPSVQFNVNVNTSQFIQDGDTITIDGTTFEFDTGAVIEVTAVDVSGLTDGDTFTLTNSVGVMRTFEFDKDIPGNLNDPNNIRINVATGNRLAIVNAIVAAINGAGFGVTATNLGNTLTLGRITLTGDAAIVDGTTTGINIDPTDYGVTLGNTAINVEETFSGNQLAFATATIVNMDPGGRGALGNLVNFPALTTINNIATVRTNVIVDRGTAGGIAGTNFEIDFFFSDTADEVAAAIGLELNTQLGPGTVNVTGNLVQLQSPQDNFDLLATDIPPFDITGGGTGGTITGLAILNGTLFAITDVGGLFIINDAPNRGQATLTFIGTVAGGADFQGLSTGPQTVENGRYSNMLFGITGSGDLYAFNTSGVLQPIFVDGATSVSTGLTGATGLEFSNLDRNLWSLTDDRETEAGHGINPLFSDSIHGDGFDRSVIGSNTNNLSLYFGNDFANNPYFNGSSANNSVGGLAGGAHGTLETNSFSLQGYSGDDLPTLYFNYFLESQDQNVLLDQLPAMLDSFRVHIWNSSTGQWDILTTNNSAREPNPLLFRDEYDYQLPPGTAEDRFIQEAFNTSGQWRQVRVNLSPYAGLSDLRLRFDFSSDGSLDLGNTNSTGTEVRAKAGSEFQDGQTFSIDNVTFEFDRGFTVNVPSGAHFVNGDRVTVTAPNGASRTFVFGTDIAFAATDTAAIIANRLVAAISGSGLLGVTAVVEPGANARVSITANGAGAPFNVQVNSSTGALVLAPGDAAGVAMGNVPIVINSTMSSIEVATVMRQAIADAIAGGQLQTIKQYKDVIRVIGHNITLGATGNEIEPNNTIATAQNVDNLGFNLALNSDIQDQLGNNVSTTIPHVTINGTGNGTFDYYSFTAQAGQRAIFDIDGATFDTELFLYNPLTGALLASNDDFFGFDNGSVSNLDAFLEFTFAQAGTYVIGVGQFDSVGSPGGITGATPPAGGSYTLNLSVGGHAVSASAVSPPPLEIANSLQGDEFGRLYQDAGLDFRTATSRVLSNYDFEGVYIDDIIIGFAERGEIATGAPTGNSGFIANPSSLPEDIHVGDYQLEIRRGTEYVLAQAPFGSHDRFNTGVLDTNDRFTNGLTITIPDGSLLFDGQTFQLSDGTNTATFEFEDLDLILTDPNFGVAQGPLDRPNFAVGFRATETSAMIAARLRDLLNSTAVRNQLKITAALAEGSVTGNRGTSSEVNIFGDITANTRGDVSSAEFNLVGTLTFQIYSRPNDEFVFTGDRNLPRVQGSVQIAQNFIFDTLNVGILIDDNIRRVGDQPVVGVPRKLPTENDERLTRGVAVVNNVVAHFGSAGIVLNGDDNNGAGPLAAVPFHRIINNTIYGGLTRTGDGIRATNNVAPTLLNNIIANTNVAINADASSVGRTVVARSSYQNNGVNGIVGVNAQLLFAGEPLFVDPSTNNFYLAARARPIDSARNQFDDRDPIVQVGDSIGIPRSNLFAPLFDAYGQFRTNDENTPNTGEGNPPFFDRGAIEREDVSGPTARLIAPEDNDGLGLDVDPDLTEVHLVNQVIRRFIVGLDDVGIGIDDTSVNTGNLQLSFNGMILTQGVDYLFRYNTNTKQITLEAASGVFAFGDYRINLVNRSGIRDLAGNNLLANRQPAGTTAFDITLAPPPVVSIQNVTVTEGDSGTTLANFVVSLSGPTQSPVTFDVQTVDGTATSSGPNPGDVDFEAKTGTVTFTPAGSLTQTFSVVVFGDTVLELDEFFTVVLTNPVDGSTLQATGTINDDELLLQLTPNKQTVVEGDVGTTDATFTVTLIDKNTGLPASPRPFDVTVGFATADDTALAGQDYVATQGTVTIAQNENTATFTVPVIGDEIQEFPPLEDFFVRLVNPVNAGVDPNFGTVPGQVTVTIQDDDPKFRVDNPVVVEGDSGTRTMIFTVSISAPVQSPVTIDYEVKDGTALAGEDYVAIAAGTLTFDPANDPNLDGDNDPLTQQVRVDIIPDTSAEGNETFSLVLSNPSAGGIAAGEGTGVGTIIEDDPRITINDVRINEGNSGTTNAVFTVTLSEASPNDVTVSYTTSIGNGVTQPPAGTIFETEPNNSVATAEALNANTFVTTPNANITDSQGVDISDRTHVTIAGRGDGTFDFFSFRGTANQRVVLDIDGATFDSQLYIFDAAGNVIAGGSNDDGFVNGGPNNNGLDAGSTSTEDSFLEILLPAGGTYTIAVGRNDSVVSAGGLTVGASGLAIERGDQYTLHVSIENFLPPAPGFINEIEPNDTFATPQNVDNAGFSNAFNPNINNQNGTNVSTTIPWISISGTGDGTADFYSVTATAGQMGIFDIDGAQFAGGATFDTILTVFRPDGSVLASNDDNPILDAGSTTSLDSFIQTVFPTTGTYRVQVTRFNAISPAIPAGVAYTLNMAIGGHALGGGGSSTGGPVVADGSANPNSDFTPITATLTIPAGMTTGEITIQLVGDTANELDETFFVRLFDAIGGVIDDGTGEGTILNDDAPIISISDPVPTPEAGPLGNPNVITFVVTLSRPADFASTIEFTTVNGTAIAGQDFVANSGTLTFQQGERVKTINVQLIKDGQLNEGTETFTVQLSNPIGANFGDDQGVGTIIDNTGLLERVLTVTAPDAGGPGIVRVFDSLNGSLRFQFDPYPGFFGGVRVATGDVNNDGTPDIVTVPGPGFQPLVKVFSGVDGSLLTQFFGYDPAFLGGMYVATGDFAEGLFSQGDSFDDIVVSPDAGGGPHVRVFSSATGPINNRQFEPTNIGNRLLFNFFAYDPRFLGGVRVAAGDVTGDGVDDLIVGAGPGGGPHVQVFDGLTRSTSAVRSFFAYDPRFLGGIYVAAADVAVNAPSTGRAQEIITGAGRGGGPHVRVFSVVANTVVVSEFFAYGANFFGGVRVAAGDINGDTSLDIITSPGPGGGPHVRAFDGRTVPGASVASPPNVIGNLMAYDPTFIGGVFVAGVLKVDFSQPLLASESKIAGSDTPALTQQDVDAAVEAALDRLRAAGVSEADLDQLGQVSVTVGDLTGNLLGLATSGGIVVDVDAAGNGWFIDPTPGRDEEFASAHNGLAAVDGTAVGRIDLLTVLLHELGHKLGLEDIHSHLHPDALMNATLAAGTRRLPESEDFDEAFTDESLFDSLLLS